MLQQQEVTLVWDLCPQNKGGTTGFENCVEKNSVTHLWVESIANVQGSREGNENGSGLGEGRRKSQRGAEGMRGDGDKMQHLCVHLWRYQHTHFTGVSPAFCQNHKAASLPVMVSTSHVPEHFYNLEVQITGWVAEECKDGCVVLSRKAAVSPQALPQNKARILAYCWHFSCWNTAVCRSRLFYSVLFAPFGLTDNIGNMKLYYQWHWLNWMADCTNILTVTSHWD